MNIVALTAGKPHQRYVIDRLHARFPLRAVFVVQNTKPATPQTLKERYWSMRTRLTQLNFNRFNHNANTSARRLAQRIERIENRLRRRAWRTELRTSDPNRDVPASTAPGRNVSPPEYHPVENLNSPDLVQRLCAIPADLILLLGCPIIRDPVLNAARLGVLNCHTSLLPDFRGSCPEHWILLTGRHECAGVTIHWATPQLDAGEIAVQRPVAVRRKDNPFTLRMRCMRAAVDAFAEALETLASGHRPARAQERTTLARRARDLTPELRLACYRKCGAVKSVAKADAVLFADALCTDALCADAAEGTP